MLLLRSVPTARPARRTRARAVAPALLATLCLALSAARCADTPLGPLDTGIWGGSQGNLTVYPDSAVLELPCGAGRIRQAPIVAGEGRLEAAGFFARQAGPISINGLDWRPARYTGTRSGDVLTLSIAVDSSTLGPFKLRRGVTGQFPRCL